MSASMPLARRIARTLVNPDVAARFMGLRGASFLLMAIIAILQWPWDWSQANSWLLAAVTVALFAIGGFSLQQAWRSSDRPPQRDNSPR